MQLYCTGAVRRATVRTMSKEHRGHACSCPAHRQRGARAGWLAVVLPVLACAVCPVCLGTYAQVFSALGVGFHFSERAHTIVLLVAVGLALGVSGWRSLRTRRGRPVSIAATGCAVLLGGHLVEARALELAGMAILVGGAIAEQLRVRRAAHLAAHAPAIAWTPMVTPIAIEHAPITAPSPFSSHGRVSRPRDAPAAPEIAAMPTIDPAPNSEM